MNTPLSLDGEREAFEAAYRREEPSATKVEVQFAWLGVGGEMWRCRAALAERPAPKGAIAAFEEAYKRSAEDPSCAGELKIWCEAWSAAAPDAVPADQTPADFATWLLSAYRGDEISSDLMAEAITKYNAECAADAAHLIAPLAAAKQEGRPDWRELCRRLYVELFYCDQQMTHAMNKKGQPMWQTGRIVREVLADARQSLEAFPASPKETRHE